MNRSVPCRPGTNRPSTRGREIKECLFCRDFVPQETHSVEFVSLLLPGLTRDSNLTVVEMGLMTPLSS